MFSLAFISVEALHSFDDPIRSPLSAACLVLLVLLFVSVSMTNGNRFRLRC